MPEVLNLEKLAVKNSFETDRPEKDSLVWENHLHFESQLESGLEFVRDVLDPFQILRKLEKFERSLQKLIILTTLAITVVYNIFIFIFSGILLIKIMTLALYLITKAIKLLGRIISVFTNCMVCSNRRFFSKKEAVLAPVEP